MIAFLAKRIDKDTIQLHFNETECALEVCRGFRLLPNMSGEDYMGIKVRFIDKWEDIMSWRKILNTFPIASSNFTRGKGKLWFVALRCVLADLCHDLLREEFDTVDCKIEVDSCACTAKCDSFKISHETTLNLSETEHDCREALV